MRGKIKVALIPHEELRTMCQSYCMVAAIHNSLKVINDDQNFLHFVAQNPLAGVPLIGAAPVDSEVANPAELRRTRENIFQQECVPHLKTLHSDSPAVFAAWVNYIETQKASMLIDIQSRFNRVQDANARRSEHLLASKRFVAAVGATAGCAVVVLGAGAALIAMGTVAMAAVGTATASQAAAAALTAGGAGAVTLFYDVFHFGAAVRRKLMHVDKDVDLLAMGAVKGAGVASENFAQIEHGSELVMERNIYSSTIRRLIAQGNARMMFSPTFRKIWEENAALNKALGKHVLRGATAGVATVFCAGLELHEHYEQLMKDWKDETKNGGE